MNTHDIRAYETEHELLFFVCLFEWMDMDILAVLYHGQSKRFSDWFDTSRLSLQIVDVI